MRTHTPALSSLVALTLSFGVLATGCSDQQLNSKEDGGGDGGTTSPTGGEGEGEEDNYEDGCILVDGGGGYRWINDAITVAVDGSVIELCATEGDSEHEEAVVVDKRVSIVGPGRDNFTLAPPTNENGIVVTASGASVSGLSIVTTRSGVVVGDAAGTDVSGVTLDDIKVDDAPNWGISVEGSSDITISNVELANNTYGGISVDEAIVRVDTSILRANTAYGIFATNGSEVTIAGTEVEGTQPTDPDNIADGHGVYANEGSLIATDGSAFIGNTFVNVFADEADLDMVGDEIVGALYGVVEINGDASLDAVTIADGAFHGAFLITTGSVSLSNMAVSGDPEVVVATADTEWNVTDDAGNTPIAGAAVVIQAPDITVSDSTIVGYNNAGLVLFTADTGTAAVARVTLTDNGQHGLYMAGHQLTMEDVDISGVFEIGEVTVDDACTTVDRYGGAIFVNGSVVWSGGSATLNEGYGASGIRTAMDISGVDFAANGCAGIMAFGGDLVADSNTFSQSIPDNISNSLLAASVVVYQGGSASVTNSSFFDNQRVSNRVSSVYDAGTYTYYYEYRDHTGADMYVYESGPTVVSGNTFVDGVQGVQTFDTPLEVSNNTFTNYFGTTVGVSGEFSTEVSDNEFTDVGGTVVSCSSGDIALEDNVVSGGGAYSYSYDYYRDDEFQYETTSNSLSSVVNLYTCSLSMEGDEISNRASNVLYSYNGSDTNTMALELIDVTVDQINDNELGFSYYGAFFSYAFYGTTDYYLENVEITNVVDDHGIEIYNANLDAFGQLTMVDSTIDSVAGNGLYLYGAGATADIQGSTISNTGEEAVYVSLGAEVALSDSLVSSSAESNITLLSGGVLTLDTAAPSTSDLATLYGVTCSTDAVINDCSALDLVDNVAGAHLGCEAFCDDESVVR